MATKATKEAIQLSGIVESLRFSKPEFCIGSIISGHRKISFTVKGFVNVGEHVTLLGDYETHEKWGRQFVGQERIYTLPADPAGLVSFLRWYVDGLGPVKSQSLVDAFGMDLPRLAESDPQQVAIEAKISIETVEQIAAKWQEFASRIGVMTKLAGMGLTQRQVEQIVEKFKGSAVAILESDAYAILGVIDGISFGKCDEIARKFGVTPTDPRRVRAALAWVVRQAYSTDGHTAMTSHIAQGEAIDLLEKDQTIEGHDWKISTVCDDLVGLGRMIVTKVGDAEYYSHPIAHRAEMWLSRYFEAASEPNPFCRESSDDG